MNTKEYYRIVREFKGQEHVFIPEYCYESYINDSGMNNIKEICFSKKLECCFFSIGLYLKEGEYYIYKTNQEPDVDLSNCKFGDFAVFEEVRYKKPIHSICIGKLTLSGMIVNQIFSAYRDIVRHDDVKTQKIIAKDWLIAYKDMSKYIEKISFQTII